MTKAEIATIHNEINAATASVLARHNLQANESNISYSESDFTYKMKVNVLDNATGSKKISNAMIGNAYWLLAKNGYRVAEGNVESIFGKELETPTIGKIKLVDVDTKKHKYPFIVQSNNGNRYKLSADYLMRYAGIEYTKQ